MPGWRETKRAAPCGAALLSLPPTVEAYCGGVVTGGVAAAGGVTGVASAGAGFTAWGVGLTGAAGAGAMSAGADGAVAAPLEGWGAAGKVALVLTPASSALREAAAGRVRAGAAAATRVVTRAGGTAALAGVAGVAADAADAGSPGVGAALAVSSGGWATGVLATSVPGVSWAIPVSWFWVAYQPAAARPPMATMPAAMASGATPPLRFTVRLA